MRWRNTRGHGTTYAAVGSSSEDGKACLLLRRVAMLLIPSVCGCADEYRLPPPRQPASERDHTVLVRRTRYGIPHIKAADLAGVGAGLGYAQAQDGVCTLADQILKVRSERAMYLGRGENDANVESDLVHLALGFHAFAEREYRRFNSPVQELIEGFVGGYNHYLEKTAPRALPPPCTGAKWVKPMTPADLVAYSISVSSRESTERFMRYVADAQAPRSNDGGAPRAAGQLSWMAPAGVSAAELGSNGWAIGSDRAAAGRAMLVANPHFPWEGELRFYESHLSIPGVLDVYGASLLGLPVINIGFNRQVAWTHTVTSARHLTAYRLALTPGDPTSYIYEGGIRKMSRDVKTIDVLEPDGSHSNASRVFWRSHYGPMLKGPGLPWDAQLAYTFHDANSENYRFIEQWLRLNMAQSLEEFVDAHAEVHGVPWVNTIAASTAGTVMYMDGSRVPNLSQEAVDAFVRALHAGGDVRQFATYGVMLLDGSTSRDEWVGIEDRAREGLVPFIKAPQLVRRDFVMNANDHPTYSNPDATLSEFPLVYGRAEERPSPRTHMNLAFLSQTDDDAASGVDHRFSLEELESALMSNRSWVAEQLLTPVVDRCRLADKVNVDGLEVDITGACEALASWDGQFDLDRVGPIVWREFLAQFTPADLVDAGVLFADGFDPKSPVSTPRHLAPARAGTDPVLENLGRAVVVLRRAGMAVETRLGAAQWTRNGESKIAVHGGLGDLEGIVNAVGFGSANSTRLPRASRGEVISERTGLTRQGYPVNWGSSFIMVLEFLDQGPRARALLVYSQSMDPKSVHFADQMQLFATKTLRPVSYEEDEILRDPELTTEALQFGENRWSSAWSR